jgi:hypothetical protein
LIQENTVPKDNNPRGNPNWKKGMPSPNPTARKKGVVTKVTRVLAAAEEFAAKYDLQPLDYMFMVINDENVGRQLRLEAAKAAAPYVHMKMPTRLDVHSTGEQSQAVMFVPYFSSEKEWELAASSAQAQLKKEVKE